MSEPNKILVIEDDEAIRFGTAMRLRSEGYVVTEANQGDAGFAQAISHRPDVILMDICMPQMDGLTALRQLKANETTAHIPVVMVSASVGDQPKALEYGAKFFLSKPFTADSLLNTIRSIV